MSIVTPELELPYAQNLLPGTESSSCGAPPSLPQFPFGKHCCLHGVMAKEAPLSGREELDGQREDVGTQILLIVSVGMHLMHPWPWREPHCSLSPCPRVLAQNTLLYV